MKKHSTSRNRTRGFSIVELLVVIAIIMILSAAAIIQIDGALNAARRETALVTTITQMRQAHERAIDERKIYRLSFLAPSTLQLDQVVIGGGGVRTFTFVSSMQLPTGFQFARVVGMPVAANTPPDGFGTGANAIDFSVDNGGGLTEIYFQPDGRALDNVGRLNNGVVYIAKPGELMSLRAVSMYGAAGRMKPWKLINLGGGGVAWQPS